MTVTPSNWTEWNLPGVRWTGITGNTVTTTNVTFTWVGTAEIAGWGRAAARTARSMSRLARQVEQDIQREDAEMAVPQFEVMPVSPVAGALVSKRTEESISPLHRFDRWTDDETFLILGSDEEQKAVEWEVLTPAFHGYSYERACGLADGGYPGQRVSIMSWSSIYAMVRQHGRSTTDQMNSDHVAALAPMVNPATESPEQTIERLTKAKARLEEGLRARMVAHGVYRNWCGEFDPILDSSGLGPRKAKGWVHGTLSFRAEVNGDLTDPAVIEKVKNNPGKYIAWDKVKVEVIETEPAVNAPMLSI